MHWAAQNGHVNAIKALKEDGADVAAQDKDRRTPMHWAAQNGHMDAIEALKEAGADVAAQDKYGSTPMYSATDYGHVTAIKGTGVNFSKQKKPFMNWLKRHL